MKKMISSGDLQFCYCLIFMVVVLSTGKFTEESPKLVLKCIFAAVFRGLRESLSLTSLNRFHNSSSLFNNIGNFALHDERHL